MNVLVEEPWHFLGIEFAPLKVPLKRRLETLAILWVILLYFASGPIGICTFIYGWFSEYRGLAALYTVWVIFDNFFLCVDPRLRSDWVRNWICWKYANAFFPIKVHKTAELDPSKSYLAGYHPHGVMPNGASLGLGLNEEFNKTFPNISPTLCVLDMLMWLPGHRELLVLLGVRSVAKKSIRRMATIPGNMTVIIVGGAAESLEGEPGRYRLILRNRKGFIREALLAGASLVPIFSFGEIDSFPIVKTEPGSWGRKIQDWVKTILGYTVPFIKGRGVFQYSFGIMPHRHPMNVVVGRPIHVEEVSNPSKEQIADLHETYMKELIDIFESNKAKFQPNATLEIH